MEEEEIELTHDAIRYLYDYLDQNDQKTFAQVNDAWRYAVSKQNQEIWQQEWENFEKQYENEKYCKCNPFHLPPSG